MSGSVVTTIEQSSGDAYHNFLADVFDNATEYVWRIKVKDTKSQLYSLFSDWVVFKCSAAPVLNITFPIINNYVITTDIPTFTHSYSDPEGKVQKNYYYQVYADDETTLIWQSDTIIGTGTQIVMPASYLQTNTYYKIRVIAQNLDGIIGTSAFRRFYVNLVTLEITPQLTVEEDSDNARFNITWSDIASIPGYYTGTENYVSSIFGNGLQLVGDSGEKLYWIKYIPSVFTISGWFIHNTITKTILFLYKDEENYIRLAYDSIGQKFYIEINVNGIVRTTGSSTTALSLNDNVFYCIKQNTTSVIAYTKINSDSIEKWGDI